MQPSQGKMLTAGSQNLKNFVPQPLWALKKPNEWETVILKEHSRYAGAKKSMDDAKLDYLSIVKTWSFYGTTFFPACKVQGGAKNLPSKVVIGVNYEGIRLYKPKNKVRPAMPSAVIPCSYSRSPCRNSSLSTSSRRSAAGPHLRLPSRLSMATRLSRSSTPLRRNRCGFIFAYPLRSGLYWLTRSSGRNHRCHHPDLHRHPGADAEER